MVLAWLFFVLSASSRSSVRIVPSVSITSAMRKFATSPIRNQIEAVDADTKWAALELMLASSASVVALAKKITKPDTKTITRKTSIPKTKVIKQPVQQPSKPAANDAARTAINPIIPQEPLSNQQRN